VNDQQPHNDPTPGNDSSDDQTQPANAQATQADQGQGASIAPFAPDRFYNDLWFDSAIRWSVIVLVATAAGYLFLYDLTSTTTGLAVVMLLAFGWIAINAISATTWRTLPQITTTIAHNPDAAEALLAEQLKRRPLVRWVRLMLYHRLASIRHRQQRFHESANICQTLLNQSLGPARNQRNPLLLMLLEASLHTGQLHAAYSALLQLHAQPLTLVESLQRLTLQTRYEVLAGHDHAALAGVRKKLLLSELMPAEHCGAMHAMLTTSATRTGQQQLADWLWRRTKLLSSPAQLKKLFSGPFAIAVVAPPDHDS
jgi:hypothetical protein